MVGSSEGSVSLASGRSEAEKSGKHCLALDAYGCQNFQLAARILAFQIGFGYTQMKGAFY